MALTGSLPVQHRRLDTQAIGLALCALAGVALLPWYVIEDGFWGLQWLLAGFPLASQSAPALFLWFKAANLWLLPVGLVVFLIVAIASRRPRSNACRSGESHPRRSRRCGLADR